MRTEPKLFTYDWITDGEPCTYTVDLRFENAPPVSQTICLLFVVESGVPGNALSPREKKRIDKLFQKATKLLGAVSFAGSIESPTRHTYIYYTSDSLRIAMLEDFAAKVKRLYASAKEAHDPEWATYYEALVPDAPKLQTVENLRIIDAMKKRGDGLTAKRRVRFMVFFPTEPARLQFQEQIRNEGFAIGEPIFRPEQTLPYGIGVYALCALEKMEINALTTRLLDGSKAEGGLLMGWDCQIVPKVNPLMR